MNELTGVLGLFLVAAIMVNALWTTLSTTGGGPLSSRLSGALWQFARSLRRRTRLSSSLVLQVAGPAILLAVLVVWIIGLWTGWTLIFSAVLDAVQTSQTSLPADASFEAMSKMMGGTGPT